MVLHYRN